MEDADSKGVVQASAMALKEAVLSELHTRVTQGEKDADGSVKPAGAATIKVALDYLKMFSTDLEAGSSRQAKEKSDKLTQMASTLPFPGQRRKV